MSENLKHVFLLVDIRHEPALHDCQMFDWIANAGYRPIVIATKLDKINRSQLQKQCSLIRKKLGMRPDDVLIPFSSETKQGRDELWKVIDQAISEVNNE